MGLQEGTGEEAAAADQVGGEEEGAHLLYVGRVDAINDAVYGLLEGRPGLELEGAGGGGGSGLVGAIGGIGGIGFRSFFSHLFFLPWWDI